MADFLRIEKMLRKTVDLPESSIIGQVMKDTQEKLRTLDSHEKIELMRELLTAMAVFTNSYQGGEPIKFSDLPKLFGKKSGKDAEYLEQLDHICRIFYLIDTDFDPDGELPQLIESQPFIAKILQSVAADIENADNPALKKLGAVGRKMRQQASPLSESELDEQMRAIAGQKWRDRFHSQKVLGSASIACVYGFYDQEREKEVAIKILRKDTKDLLVKERHFGSFLSQRLQDLAQYVENADQIKNLSGFKNAHELKKIFSVLMVFIRDQLLRFEAETDFENEVQNLVSSVVPCPEVYDFGKSYIMMEVIPGPSLDRYAEICEMVKEVPYQPKALLVDGIASPNDLVKWVSDHLYPEVTKFLNKHYPFAIDKMHISRAITEGEKKIRLSFQPWISTFKNATDHKSITGVKSKNGQWTPEPIELEIVDGYLRFAGPHVDFSLNSLKSYYAELVSSIASMIANNWYHGDLHPGNIKITSKGLVFIDFGLIQRFQIQSVYQTFNVISSLMSSYLFDSLDKEVDGYLSMLAEPYQKDHQTIEKARSDITDALRKLGTLKNPDQTTVDDKKKFIEIWEKRFRLACQIMDEHDLAIDGQWLSLVRTMYLAFYALEDMERVRGFAMTASEKWRFFREIVCAKVNNDMKLVQQGGWVSKQ